MNNSVRSYVEGFFERVPFSEAASDAQRKIIHTLQTEYDAGKTYDDLVKSYPSLPALAEHAGYSPEDVHA